MKHEDGDDSDLELVLEQNEMGFVFSKTEGKGGKEIIQKVSQKSVITKRAKRKDKAQRKGTSQVVEETECTKRQKVV